MATMTTEIRLASTKAPNSSRTASPAPKKTPSIMLDSKDDNADKDSVESAGPVQYIIELVNNMGQRIDVKHGSQPIKLDSKVTPTVLQVIETRTAQAAPKALRSVSGMPEVVPEDSDISSLNIKTCRVRILSSKLINALRSVVRYYPGQSLFGEKLEFRQPYQFLVHYQHELEAYKNNHPPQHDAQYRKECNEHIDHLLDFLRKSNGKERAEEEERHKRGFATFEYLWMLLKPGEDVFINDRRDERLTSGVLERVKGGYQDGQGQAKEYKGWAWGITYTDGRLCRVYHSFFIQPFDGEREIKTQWVYPVKFHKDWAEALRSQGGMSLVEQMKVWGQTYWNLTQRCLKSYHGKKYTTNNDRIVDGKVMVDFEAYTEEKGDRFSYDDYSDSESGCDDGSDGDRRGPSGKSGRRFRRLRLERPSIGKGWSCECENCLGREDTSHSITFYNYDSVDPQGEPPNKDHYFFLCDRNVPAFSLRDREFVILDISHIEEPTFDTEAFRYLVLDSDIKRTIQNLAFDNFQRKSAPNQKQFSADFIKGKGEGQVFLLHGAPGVGKTATAECVAEFTKRPLLSLSSGDLGTTASILESRLDKYLRLGERWGAIVLIDEADIYLEKRDLVDIRRNSLVAVLLRALEYYQGILFLTTNRVGVFDEAFISRIHVPLYFKHLTDGDRVKIWSNNFLRLQKETGMEVHDTAKSFISTDKKLLDLKWNGREIRNAFQTAVALAEAEAAKNPDKKPVLGEEHIAEVVNLASSFHDYLVKLHGHDAEYLAGSNKIRVPVGVQEVKSPIADAMESLPNSVIGPGFGLQR